MELQRVFVTKPGGNDNPYWLSICAAFFLSLLLVRKAELLK